MSFAGSDVGFSALPSGWDLGHTTTGGAGFTAPLSYTWLISAHRLRRQPALEVSPCGGQHFRVLLFEQDSSWLHSRSLVIHA